MHFFALIGSVKDSSSFVKLSTSCFKRSLSGFLQTTTQNFTSNKLSRRGVNMASKCGLEQEKQVGTEKKVVSLWTFLSSCPLTRPFTTNRKTPRTVACMQGGTRGQTTGERQEDFSMMLSIPGKNCLRRYFKMQLIPNAKCTRNALKQVKIFATEL